MKHLFLALFAVSIVGLIKHTQAKVVKIGIVTEKHKGTCSGAFISPDGRVLTCAHCFSGEEYVKKIYIKTSKGRVYHGALLVMDKEADLALVKVDVDKEVPYFTIGKEAVIGQQVLAFGSPLGIQHTVSVGFVENLLREGKLYVMHGAFINPGNSGGPLVNLRGQLVGVNEAMIMANMFVPANGLYIAVSVDSINKFMENL